jgi:hypothetical protein
MIQLGISGLTRRYLKNNGRGCFSAAERLKNTPIAHFERISMALSSDL